jgi:hypothetical protein
MCICGRVKASVSLEVNAALKWLLVYCIAKSFSYIYTTLVFNTDVSWISTIFVGITIVLIYVHLHRSAVAKAKLQIEDGDEKWTWCVVVVTLSTAAFFGSILLARNYPNLFHALHSADPHGHATPTMMALHVDNDLEGSSGIYILVHLLFYLSLLFDIITFVLLNQFQVTTNDEYV